MSDWLGRTALLLGLVGLLFSIEDLLGPSRTRRLERHLRWHALRSLVRLCALRRFLVRALPHVAIVAGTLLLSVPLLAAIGWALRFGEPRGWLSTTSWILALVVGLMGASLAALIFLPKVLRTAGNVILKRRGRPPRAVAVHLLRHARKLALWPAPIPYSFEQTALIGFIVALAFTTAFSLMLAYRILVLFARSVVWLLFAAPVLFLHRIADKLGNPSWLKVGKYSLLIFSLALLIVRTLRS